MSEKLRLMVGISIIWREEMLVEAPVFSTAANLEVGAAMTTASERNSEDSGSCAFRLNVSARERVTSV